MGTYCWGISCGGSQADGATPLFGNSFVQPFKGYSLYYSKVSGYTVVPEGIEQIKKGPYRVANMRNILAKIEGKNPDEIVVVGAHYDHLGYDPMLADDFIYNGADDNASGVQVVLQILQAFLATGQQPERTVIFALWDGEEKGLCGSKYFVNNFADIKKVKGYMNFDMIGRDCVEDRKNHFNFMYTAKDSVYAEWLKNDIKQYSLHSIQAITLLTTLAVVATKFHSSMPALQLCGIRQVRILTIINLLMRAIV